MLYYAYFANAGIPETGLTPDWEYLITAENGTDKSGSAPAIAEAGGGWYNFNVTLGTAPWDVVTEDLLGVVDGGAALANVDRYKPVSITLRGMGLARIAHKMIQNLDTGDMILYGVDGTTEEMQLDMSDLAAGRQRNPIAP